GSSDVCSSDLVVPHIAVWRVVLSDRAPLALGQVRAPPLPVPLATRVLREAFGFRSGHEVPPDATRRLASRSVEFGACCGVQRRVARKSVVPACPRTIQPSPLRASA